MLSSCKHGDVTRARRAWLSPALLIAALSPAVLQTSGGLSCNSGDTRLAELAIVVGGEDQIEFQPGVLSYAAWVPAGSDVVSIRARPTDPKANVWVYRTSVSGRVTPMVGTVGGGDVGTTLEPGLNTILVRVRAPGGALGSYETHVYVGPRPLCTEVDCADDNDCTVDHCDPVDGSCSHVSVEDGSACSFGLVSGECIVGTCTPFGVTATVCAQGCDFFTIQAAIDAAFYDDTILVRAGTYEESINFIGKEIAVVAEAGAASTFISGLEGPVVTFESQETRSAVLQGFTITNGFASEGGGIKVQSASPSITENVIVDNLSCAGAGIGIGFGSPLILRNQIVGNAKYGCSGGIGGGGISIRGASVAEVIDNLIADNASSNGGGISLFAAGDPTIRGNEIRDNVAAYEGGGLWLVNRSDALITQNIVHGNVATEGGGLYWGVPSSARGPRLVNNTIAGNHSPMGSGILAAGFHEEAALYNNIIIGKLGQVAVLCDGTYGDQEPIFAHNDVFSEGAAAYGGACSDHTGERSNISRDPLFVNPGEDDFDIKAMSPVIDVGDTMLVDLPLEDFRRRPRPMDGDGDGVAEADIGAFEYQGDVGGVATVPLQVVRTWPSPGEREVELDETVRAEIAAALIAEEPSIQSFLVLEDQHGDQVDGTVELDASSGTIVFTPAVSFALLGAYTVTIRAPFVDESGEVLVGEHAWSFEARDGQWGSAERFDGHVGGSSQYPRVAMTSSGEALGLWKHFDGQKNYLWTRRFDPEIGWTDAFRHVTPEVEPERGPNLPAVAIDRDRNSYIVTGQFMNGGFRDLWAQRFDAAQSQWSPMERLEVLPGVVNPPEVLVDDFGVVTAAWAQVGMYSLNVWVSRYSPGSGWSEAEVLMEAEGNAEPALAGDTRGSTILVMQSFCPGFGFCIAASIYRDALDWTEPHVINPGRVTRSQHARVAMNANGDAVVVWEEFDGQSSDVWTSQWSPSGDWSEPVLLETQPGDAANPQVAIDDAGNALAVWSQHDGVRRVITASRFAPDEGWSAPGPIDRSGDDDADQVRLVMDRKGNAIAVWRQALAYGDRLWVNRFSPSQEWADPVRIDGDANASADARVALDGRGRAFVIWVQRSSWSWEIWVRRFD